MQCVLLTAVRRGLVSENRGSYKVQRLLVSRCKILKPLTITNNFKVPPWPFSARPSLFPLETLQNRQVLSLPRI